MFDASSAKLTDRAPEAYAEALVLAGAGEILLSSVDEDGSQAGYDLKLVKQGDSGDIRTGDCLWWRRAA